LPKWAGGNQFKRLRQFTPPPVVIVTDPEFANFVLNNPESFQRSYTELTALGEESMFIGQDYIPSDASKWKHAHKAMMRYLTPKAIMSRYLFDIRRYAKSAIEDWGNGADIQASFAFFSLATASHTLLDYDLTSQDVAEIEQTLDKVMLLRDVPVVHQELKALARRIIKSRQTKISQGKAVQDDLLGALLTTAEENELSPGWVEDQVITIFFASQETTKSFLAWAVYELALHPEWADKIATEYRAAGDQPDAIWKASKMDRFVNEVLRLHPVVPSFPRISRFDIQYGDYKISKGSFIMLSPALMHQVPAIWGPSAGEFNPDRFEGLDLQKGCFMPFGMGPRGCIGSALARMEVRILLGELASSYRIELPSDYVAEAQMRAGAILQLKERLRLKVTARNSSRDPHASEPRNAAHLPAR
jgi:cytochrome P450